MDDIKKAVAYVFKTAGVKEMPKMDFIHALSLKLNWLTIKESQKFLKLAMQNELLNNTKGMLSPAFDVAQIKIPLTFAIDSSILDAPEKKEDIFSEILDVIAQETGISVKDLVSKINKIQQGMNVDSTVAALVHGREMDVDIGGFIDAVEKEVYRSYGG